MDILLNCSVCHNKLTQPITLSCGYTVCLKSLPLLSQQTSFICPVKECKQTNHLFGPDLVCDNTISKLIGQKTTPTADILQCSICNHLLDFPVTNHCGHTFCKLCLLRYRILNDTCRLCHKRLPSYQFIQQQLPNALLMSYIVEFLLPQQRNTTVSDMTTASKTISFLNVCQPVYKSIPVCIVEFPILPTQKVQIPIFIESHRQFFLNSLLLCKEYQCLCFALVMNNKNDKPKFNKYKGNFGTIVKVTAVEQRTNDMIVSVSGLERLQVISVIKETNDSIVADIEIKFENKADYYLTTSSSSEFKLAVEIHDFINSLALSQPSISFQCTMEGLLGPTWLEAVQELHGPLPSVDDTVALCWWSAVVLPVSNTERYHLLETESLESRLQIVLAWIHELRSQWQTCKRIVNNTTAKVWHN
ncbi:MAG: hypothetical protein EXX96DRAFT_527796 [Benjaminiella poitrasii]|nr:MAG: hypothetical protein EXX96DRAFT_527796 [Benjaminiella poitrasii]